MKKFSLLLFLFFYLFLTFIFSQSQQRGDEGIYIKLAENFSKGEINLHDGPGYPAILSLFVITNIPWFFAKLLNAIFLFVAILYYYNILRLYSLRASLFFTFLFGLYFPFYTSLVYISPQIFKILLLCGFIYHYLKVMKGERKNINLGIAVLFSGYLVISDVFLTYVFVTIILVLSVLWVKKRSEMLKRTIFIMFLTVVFSLPYIIYSYSLTGKIFYLTTNIGSKLYWLSTPYENEYGDWHHSNHFNLYPQLKENHFEFWKSLDTLNSIKRDEVLIQKAVDNILNKPGKFFINWLSNVGRIFFSYPYSYTYQKLSTFFYLIPNVFLIVITILLFIIQKKLKIKIPKELELVFIFALIIFLFCSFLSSDVSDSFLFIPFIIIYIAIILFKIKIIPNVV